MGHENNDNPAQEQQRPISVRGQLEHILAHLPADELSQFVLETAVYDSAFRETFLITFSDLLSEGQREESRYQTRLHKILAQYTNKDGYISHKNAAGLIAAITSLLDTARKATTPTRESIDLSIAVLSIMPELGEKMDDSEEYLYTLMEQTCTVLLECFDALNPEAQQDCLERILGIYAEPAYLDLDLDSFLLVLLKDWARDDKMRQAACLRTQEAMLKGSEDDQWRKSYLIEQTNNLLAYWKSE
uniref:Uncharacterized protein n=1 Tax=uncultured Thiotrichaceae bacterium TaxID=298394 RepID=A0A6S6T986_9GAMM|nr:MAG: Unknown protein [uncultured Thiotrichaceae bacterium]